MKNEGDKRWWVELIEQAAAKESGGGGGGGNGGGKGALKVEEAKSLVRRSGGISVTRVTGLLEVPYPEPPDA